MSAPTPELDRVGVTPPQDWLRPYPIDAAEFDRVDTPHKYRVRPYNIGRDLLRVQRFIPELLDDNAPPQQILDLSSGACALAEFLPAKGHSVSLSDYEVGPDSRYGPIHSALGVAHTWFDGTQSPLPFPDQCADVVTCFQAMDFYTKDASAYPALFTEMTRLARRKVVVVWNSADLVRPNETKIVIDRLAPRFDLQVGRCFDTTLLTTVWTRPS